MPQVFFTDPEAAAVGLSAEQATAAGHRVAVVDVDFAQAQGREPATPTATRATPGWSSTSTAKSSSG